MPRFFHVFLTASLIGLLSTPAEGLAANGIMGLYLTVPEGFDALSAANSVEIRSKSSFCTINWQETLKSRESQPNRGGVLESAASKGGTTAIERSEFQAAGVDYITWRREIRGPVTSVVGTATCPSWSADGMDNTIRRTLKEATLARNHTEQAFAGLPFITDIPEGFKVKRRFANSIVLGGNGGAGIPEGDVTLSSLQIREPELGFEELATSLLANQSSLTDIVITSKRNIAVNGLRGQHLLAAGNANGTASRIHQVLIGNAEGLVLITLSVPDDSTVAKVGGKLAAENQLLVKLMTSLRVQ